MARDDDQGPERREPERRTESWTCVPYRPIRIFLETFSHCCWRPEQLEGSQPSDPTDKKYFHTPTHAASSFLKTTTTRNMQSANEIL